MDMNNRAQAAAILVVAIFLMAPLAPLTMAGCSFAIAPTASDDGLPGIVFQEEDGVYVMRNEYLEKVFGTFGIASTVDDPLGDGALVSSPQEFVTPNGGRMDIHEWGNGSSLGSIDDLNGSDTRNVRFSAGLTRDDEGDKRDWMCELRHETDGLHLAVRNMDSTTYDVNVSSALGYPAYPWDAVTIVSTLQSPNILPYCVADFDGDGNEEIAVYYYWSFGILGWDGTDSRLELMYTVPVYTYTDRSTNSIHTPIDMAAGDVDGDGVDELVYARGYYEGSVGNMECTYLGIGDVPTGTSRGDRPVELPMNCHRVTIMDPKNTASPLDSLMTSISIGDVDRDGTGELVIGGYLWDNTQRGAEYNRDWARSAGELYLAYSEFDDLLSWNDTYRALTVLGDDDGSASTRYIRGDSNFEKRYKLDDHNVVDTSIYLTDDNDDPLGLCRSVNWSNWTIPMATGCISPSGDVIDADQVFFDRTFYHLDGGRFSVHASTPDLTYVMDGNNIVCFSVEHATIEDQDLSVLSGTGEFFLSYGSDLESHFDDGRTEYAFVVYGHNDGPEVTATYSTQIPGVGWRILTEWNVGGAYNAMIGDFDHDTYYTKYISHMFTYTDPTVTAFLSALPYEGDLAKLVNGADNIGHTSYAMSEGSSVMNGSTFHFDFAAGVDVGFERIISVGAEGGYTLDDTWSQTGTVEFSMEWWSSHDSVAMCITPMDIYLYKVYVPSGTTHEVQYAMVPYYGKPVAKVLGIDRYNEFVDDFNGLVAEYAERNGVDAVSIPKITPDHEEGDPVTYDYEPVNPINVTEGGREINVSYNGSDTSGGTIVTMTISESEEMGHADGGQGTVSVFSDRWLVDYGIDFNVSGNDFTNNSDFSGISFSSTMMSGLGDMYIGDADDLDVLDQYYLSAEFWAEERSFTYGDAGMQTYVYVGYTTRDHGSAPALGSVAPNTHILDGTDDSDAYNPTADSVCLLVTVPGYADSHGNAGDEYVVEMSYQGVWYPVGDLGRYGLTVEEETSPGTWSPGDGRLSPGDDTTCMYVRIGGLDAFDSRMFEFRVTGYTHTGGLVGGWNPSPAVTAYTETILAVVGSTTVLEDVSDILRGLGSIAIVDGTALTGGGTYAVATDHAPGEVVTLCTYDGERLRPLCSGLVVHVGGYIIYSPDTAPDTGPVPIGAVLCILVGFAALLAMVYRDPGRD